jgi:hypothetical protein
MKVQADITFVVHCLIMQVISIGTLQRLRSLRCSLNTLTLLKKVSDSGTFDRCAGEYPAAKQLRLLDTSVIFMSTLFQIFP